MKDDNKKIDKLQNAPDFVKAEFEKDEPDAGKIEMFKKMAAAGWFE